MWTINKHTLYVAPLVICIFFSLTDITVSAACKRPTPCYKVINDVIYTCLLKPSGEVIDCVPEADLKADHEKCPETSTAVPTVVLSTVAPTTVSPTTVAPPTIAPTTVAPTTVAPTTVAPTTVAPTTAAPTTVAPTTVAPTTVKPTTVVPTTVVPTTVKPTTAAPTTVALTTLAPATPTRPPPCSAKGDIAFVIDGSGSLKGYYDTEKEFLKMVLSGLEIDDDLFRVSFLVYDNFVSIPYNFGSISTLEEAQEAVANLALPGAETYTNRGISAARTRMFPLARPDVPNIMIIVTDGVSTDKEQTKIEAQKAKEENIIIVAVGIGSLIDQQELKEMATSDELVLTASWEDIFSILDTLTMIVCMYADNY